MAYVGYYVEIWPSDTSYHSKATIHLRTCPDAKKGVRYSQIDLDPNGVGWWDMSSYREAEQFAETNQYTGQRRPVFNCQICEPEKGPQQ